jgi:hypothetical protein
MNDRYLVVEMGRIVQGINPDYPLTPDLDYKALFRIAEFIYSQMKLKRGPENNAYEILPVWQQLYQAAFNDQFYRDKSLNTIATHIQEFYLKVKRNDTGEKLSGAKLSQKLAARYGKRR